MSKHVVDRLRYEEATNTLRADPKNWCVAQSARWEDGHDMDGAVDYPASMARIAACVNACAGVPTEVLQNLRIRGFASVVHDSLSQGEALSTIAAEALEALASAED